MVTFISEEEFKSPRIKQLWDSIAAASVPCDYGQQHLYCSIWWDLFKEEITSKELAIFIVDSAGVSSVWPLLKRKKFLLSSLHLIGEVDRMTTFYTFPVFSAPGQFTKHLLQLPAWLKSQHIKWNYLKISIPEWIGYLDPDDFSPQNPATDQLIWRLVETYNYSTMNLPETFDQYIGSLGSCTRENARKYLRRFETRHHEFAVLEGDELIETLPHFLELHCRQWDLFKGQNNRIRILLETFVNRQSQLGNGKMIMAVIREEGALIAGILSFLDRDRCFFHYTVYVPQKQKTFSSGITVHLLFFRYLIENQIRICDFCMGKYDYKLRLGAKLGTSRQLILFRNHYSKVLYDSTHIIRHIFQKFSRIV